MDPLNALSCAAAILQFVDFSFKIIGSAYEIYTSQRGTSEETIQAREMIERLQQLSHYVEKTTIRQDRSNNPKPSTAVVKIARRAQSLADELRNTLASLDIDHSKSFQSWQAFRIALRSYLKADKIQGLQSRLDGLRNELMLHLIVIIRDEQSALYESIDYLKDVCRHMRVEQLQHMTRLNEELTRELSMQGNEIKELLEGIRCSVSPSQFRETLEGIIRNRGNEDRQFQDAIRFSTLPKEVLEVIQLSAEQRPAVAVAEIKISEYSLAVKNLAVAASEISRLVRILRSLKFEEMPFRQDHIHETYANTYSWIFNENESELAVWLTQSNSLFWVNGKAGSGKSTLFKYITNSTRTKSMLTKWARGKDLHIASFFFWNYGNMMQKSETGLLQSLLFQVLCACPDVVEYACPQKWGDESMLGLAPPSWKFSELIASLKRAFAHITDSSRLCFFIDGLDEYDGYDHARLIDLIQELQDSPSVKFCVSSRPWNVFMKSFGNSPTLILEEKTKRDMEEYIRGILIADRRFQQLKTKNDRADELAAKISNRANGVFLWVFLVIRELLRGLNEDDDFLTLKKRLDALPSDLREYFKHMLSQLDEIYRVKTARALLVAASAWKAPPIDVVYGIEYGTSREELMQLAETMALDESERASIRRTAKFRLNSWCRDLLGVSLRPGYYRVEFLHRTVRDFLCQKDIWYDLEKQAGPTFNPRLLLCRGYLARTKYNVYVALPPENRHDMGVFKEAVRQTMYYAMECERHDNLTPLEELRELDQLGKLLYDTSWTSKVWLSVNDFLAAAVACGLQLYVRQILQESPEKIFKGPSTLHPLTVYAHANGLKGFPEIPDKEVVMTKLLRNHATKYDKEHRKWYKNMWCSRGSQKVLSAQKELESYRGNGVIVGLPIDESEHSGCRENNIVWETEDYYGY
ncbi:hypothetical protein F5Y04DRAFT_257206 [Hypomontagnella monticulosa]|nr:hypothetical protein F5Y04DRAFT_257206 [Hypomontagnella monticulosa]